MMLLHAISIVCICMSITFMSCYVISSSHRLARSGINIVVYYYSVIEDYQLMSNVDKVTIQVLVFEIWRVLRFLYVYM